MKKGFYHRWLIFIVAVSFTLNVNSQHKNVSQNVLASFMEVIQDPSMSITDYLLNTNEYTTFVRALKASNSFSVLEAEGDFTVFAPNNEAFAQFPTKVMQHLFIKENVDKLKSIVDYHIVLGVFDLEEDLFKTGGTLFVKAINNEIIEVSLGSEDTLCIRDANGYPLQILNRIQLSNGVIYTIDAVILPQVDVKVASN